MELFKCVLAFDRALCNDVVRGRVCLLDRHSWAWRERYAVQILVIVAFSNRVVQGRCFLCEIALRRVNWGIAWMFSITSHSSFIRVTYLCRLDWSFNRERDVSLTCTVRAESRQEETHAHSRQNTSGKTPPRKQTTHKLQNLYKNPQLEPHNYSNHYTKRPQQGKSANKVPNLGTRTGLHCNEKPTNKKGIRLSNKTK